MERKHKNSIAKEIEESRVESCYLPNDYDFSSSTTQRRPGVPLLRSTTNIRRDQTRAHTQSFEKRPGGRHGDLDKSEKFATLDPQAIRGARAKGRELAAEKILNYGMLYKTSRRKITSDLTRGQHEHRQYRRFQLTERSLEYSQLLQSVRS